MQAEGLPIAAVERDTGLSKDLLRVWERRYGFPQPLRDAAGERCYPPEQLQRLRLLKRLLDGGLRPAQVVPLPEAALRERLAQLEPEGAAGAGGPAVARGGPAEAPAALDRLLEPLLRHDSAGMLAALQAELLRRGLGAYVQELVAPLIRRVGQLWSEGRLQIHEEHLFTELLQQQLRAALAQLPPAASARPRVLLSTLPGEEHGLGLLMVHTLLALQGCDCVSLGLQTPVEELVQAAARQQADVLALSCSAYARAAPLASEVRRLRKALPTGTALWLGGHASALARVQRLAGVRVLDGLAGLPQALQHWHAEHPAPAAP